MINAIEDNELKKVKSKSIISALSLVGQSSYSALLGFAAFFILTLKSGIYLLGIYNTVLASISFLNYFTNLGLAAALIHKKKIEEIDLNSAFFLQLILVTLAVIGGFLLTGRIFAGSKLPPTAKYLYWSVLVSLFLLSLKTIPSVLLEKKVEIYKVVVVQSVENSVFYITIIIMVLMGYGIEALVVSVLLRSVIGLILIYYFKPWRPKFSLSFSSVKHLLAYGIPFQGNSFVALVKDDLMIIYLGKVLGFEKLGLITFGKKYAEMSLRLVTDNINRVAFPLFAKFQDNEKYLKKSLEKVIFYSSLIVLPIIVGSLFVFDSLLKAVPGYFQKWHLALFSFYFFSFSTLFVSFTTPFINLFNALGKVKTSLLFMILWTVLMWLMIPFGVNKFGYNAVSIVFFIVSLTFIFVIRQAKKYVQFSIFSSLKNIFIALAAMVVYLAVVRVISLNIIANNYVHLIFSLVGAPIIYFLILLILEGTEFIKNVLTNPFQGVSE